LRFNDALTGAALVVFGLLVLWHVQAFPTIPGQKYGAGLFPQLLSIGLAVCGVLLCIRGFRSRAPALALARWTGVRRPVAAFFSVIAGLGLYVVLAGPLGFHLTGFLLLLWWTLVYGTRPAVALPVAIIAPILIHLAFYKLLRIPLPWGVLQGVLFPA
jgi:putative tricarboxylic transport membrane protein